MEVSTELLVNPGGDKSPLMELVRMARRGWKLVVAVWFVTTAIAVAYAFTAVPRYTATGVVQVSSKDALGAGNPLLDLAGQGGKQDIETEVEIMRRRDFVLGVLTKHKLQIVDPLQARRVTRNFSVTVEGASPVRAELTRLRNAAAVAKVLDPGETRVRIEVRGVDADRVELTFPRRPGVASVELAVGESYSSDALELRFESLPVDPGERLEFIVLSPGALFEAYIGRLQVAQLGSARNPTNLVQLRLTDDDRHVAAAVVQSLMEEYLQQNLEWQALRASRSAQFIREQLDEVRARLEEQEKILQKFAEAEEAVDLTTQARVTIENAAELEAERAQIELQERLVSSVIGRMSARLDSGEAVHLTANFFDDDLLGEAIGSLTDREVRFEVLRATLTDDHPSVRELGAQLSKQRAEVAKLLRTTRRNLAARAGEIDRALADVSDTLAEYPDKQLQLARLTRNVDVSQRLYSFLLEKLHESEIMEAATTTDKRIVDAAAVPHKSSAPARARVLVFGAVGGLVLGLSLVYGLRFLRQRMDTVEAIRELAPYPVYATIPAIMGEVSDQTSDRVGIADVWRSPHDPAPEAFRTLRVNVSFIPARPNRGRIIQVTSSQPGEGKSTVMSNLAVSLAKSGSRVAILDLDLRRPVQHRIWTFSRAPGLSDLVAQATPSEDQNMIRRVEEYGVDVLPAGTRVPETLSSVMSPAFLSLLRRFSERYDYVLIDSPPIFVADTMVIGQHVDLVLVTARPGHVTRSNLSHAIDFLGRLRNIRKGLVLNGVAKEHSEYYYGKNYYYYGRSYGEQGGDESRTSSSPGDSPRRAA